MRERRKWNTLAVDSYLFLNVLVSKTAPTPHFTSPTPKKRRAQRKTGKGTESEKGREKAIRPPRQAGLGASHIFCSGASLDSATTTKQRWVISVLSFPAVQRKYKLHYTVIPGGRREGRLEAPTTQNLTASQPFG